MATKHLPTLIAIFFVFLVKPASAQNPVPDSTFGVNGLVSFEASGISLLTPIRDGKLALTLYNQNTASYESWVLKANGKPDSSYGLNGMVPHAEFPGSGFDQKGRLYRFFYSNQGQALNVERRYAGSIDTTFGDSGVASFYPDVTNNQFLHLTSLNTDAQGHVIIMGNVTQSSLEAGLTITADSNGNLINLFRYGAMHVVEGNDKVKVNDYLFRRQDSLLILVGSTRAIGSLTTYSLVKTVFGAGNGNTYFPNTGGIERVLESTEGKILCMAPQNIHRIDPESGTLDNSFGINGKQTFPVALKGLVQIKGNRILAITSNEKLVCLTENGAFDTSFGTEGYFTLPSFINSTTAVRTLHRIDSSTVLVSWSNKLYRLKLDPSINTSTTASLAGKRGKLHPNPASDIIQISTLHTHLEIYDVMGRKVAVPAQRNLSGFEVNVQALSSGCYTLRLGTGPDAERLRFVKE